MSRLPKVTRDDIPEKLRYVWDRNAEFGDGLAKTGASQRTEDDVPDDSNMPNIMRAMANNPEVWQAQLRLGKSLWMHCGLDAAMREMVILRTSIIERSEYEWQGHVPLGRQAGLSVSRINALHEWRSSSLFSEPERVLLAYVDAVVGPSRPPQDLHDALAAHYPPSAIVGINVLAGFYLMSARFLEAMEVQTEQPFIGWVLSDAQPDGSARS